jgi:basic amino acid/polyamine antiporter, APA family
MNGQLEVGLIAGKHIFGANGGRIVGAIICIGLISAISSMTWIGPRVTMSMGEDNPLIRFLARKNRNGIPFNALLLQLVLVNLLLLTRSFESVVKYIGFALLLCSLLTVIGVMVLRRTRPELPRPYKVWAYPLPPLVFSAITIWMMTYLLRSNPTESLAGLATMTVGLILYLFTRQGGSKSIRD